MKWFARLVTTRPGLLLTVMGFVTLIALHGIVDLRTGQVKLHIDPGIDRLLPEGDDERRFYDRSRELFGSDEFVLLVLDEVEVFSPAVLDSLKRVTARLETERDVLRVVSLANATDITSRDGDIWVDAFYDEPPTDPAALAALRQRVMTHPVYGDALVARDGRAAAFVVFFEHIDERDFVARDVGNRLARIASEEAGTPVLVTGNPHVKARLSQTIVSELGFILPLVSLLTLVLCGLAFRSLRGVLLPAAAIAMSLAWTLGAMGWTDTPINLVSNIIPPLLITLGFAGAMHVMSEYYEALEHGAAHPTGDVHADPNRTAVRVLLEEMGLAILVNGATTVLGFLSLCTSNVMAIRQFGIWSVLGVSVATLVSLVFIPAVLAMLGAPKRRPRGAADGKVEAWAEKLAGFDIRHRKWIFTGAFALLAVALYGASRIEVSSSFVGSFVADSPVRQTFESLNERLGGLNSFFIVIEADEDNAFAQPANLRELVALQEWLEAQPEIGSSASLADGVRLLNQAFHDNSEASFAIPATPAGVEELLTFGGNAVTDGLVDGPRRTANIRVRAKISGSGEVGAFLERLNARLEELPRRLRGRATGDLVLLSHTMDDITQGMLNSDFTAFITIYLTLSLLLTSFRIGLYALLPNLIPVAVYYGALGLTGTPLNLSTSLIGAITLGIAVDDTVHYFARFALEARRLGDERKATVGTLRAVVRPVTFTTVGLCLGFLALTASELRNQVEFGLLSALTMAVGWALELTLSPAICSSIRLVTLWDLLSLDLGEAPERSIPLFHGLTKRQARVFALMSETQQLQAGQRLFSAGDKGNEMFVIIDGKLVASVEREGQQVELGRLGRGEVVGEVALFSDQRSANVDVLEDARLLRFGEADLIRLRDRYPRIAAVVHANLNRVLASRIQSTIRIVR